MQLSRRLAIQLIALIPFGWRHASAQDNPNEAVRELISIATDDGLLALDPERTLRRIAFWKAEAEKQEDANTLVYFLRIALGTRAFVQFERIDAGWRLSGLTLLFQTDEIPLDPLHQALTIRFGEPKNETMGPGSNMVLLWLGADRSIEVTADVPAISPKDVYVVTIKPRW